MGRFGDLMFVIEVDQEVIWSLDMLRVVMVKTPEIQETAFQSIPALHVSFPNLILSCC